MEKEACINRWQLAHIVDNSWMPLALSVASFSMIISTLLFLKFKLFFSFMQSFALFLFILILMLWFRDITREGVNQGMHTTLIQSGLKWALFWFLFSEVWFFFSVFWAFFHSSISPISNCELMWPYMGVFMIMPFNMPLLNTLILLVSGITATLAHQDLLSNMYSNWIIISMMLGLYFLILQGTEYKLSLYSISDSLYGSVFYFGTGFHGMHVCLGSLMLLVSAWRFSMYQLSAIHHFGVEFSLWYWHFVDVVWLFLFFMMYCWVSF